MRQIPGWLFIVGVLALVAGTAICSVVSFAGARQFAVDLGESGMQVPSFGEFLAAQPTATPSPTALPPTATTRPGDTPVPTQPGPTATVDPLGDYAITDPRRINILLMGIDQRKGETGEFNTDTMIVFSVDPVRKSVGMLSIPRDLLVDIPGSTSSRINTAERIGELNQYPGGGGALAARTVTETIGIPIDKYVLINFDVFTTVINLIAPNGVEVCPTATIDDPTYPDAGYGFIHVHFDPGCQRLDAEHLLQYARTRHTENSDFDRAKRQQEVIKAVRNEVVSAGGIVNIIGQIPALWDELSGSYKTNLTLREILQLATLASQIPQENIHSGQIGPQQTTSATITLGGVPADVLILDPTQLTSLLQSVFNPTTAAATTGQATPGGTVASGDTTANLSLAELRQRSQAENASIVVFNNTDIPGLAGQTRDWLASRQVTVLDVGNMPSPSSSTTTIRTYSDKPWTARYVAQLLGISTDQIVPASADGLTAADVMVVAGPDLQPLLSGQ